MAYWRAPLDLKKVEVPHGDIHINIEHCKGCNFCVEYCPREVLEMSVEFNRKGYHYPNVLKEGACVNCNLCEMICPEFSIFVLEGKTRHPEADEVIKGKEKS
ncbi:MAG: 4Fe-4S dicluster domain-containing protein [Candidatus Marinimicrobia bacterium]|nr:4Fe-4S dicluster domain-containing protein [Candidatus Neomarinimicrobiota bacterium]MBL7059601.1 4Fe-4S dicluster domain-containing protein [Candidatus Neomarinimicrobiota bacterium]